ncbi:amino acid ABC transporter permease [Phreatobacter stygius]|uniref:Amino acid ABC transporter permease n=1 Tax=Phreatobacter stygius TaxID=1940610 RepID=A0A4D7B4U4_9HYPH|nr:amino acid ABC transporter permease [Phreatobacter stygius]QCI68829.1 amino acid ABC transporter permease [Phreatobacter stygius]
MTDGTLPARGVSAPKVAFFNNPKIRGTIFQAIALGLLIFLAYRGISNAVTNLTNQRIAAGFGFLDNTAGFGISQTLIPWNEAMSYGRAFVVGLLNTLLVAVVGVFLATILGFIVGVARLSRNWVIAKIAYWYVEIIRNLPLLFQILFWYLAVLATMPAPRDSISLFGELFINQRGITMPKPLFQPGAGWIGIGLIVGIVVAFAVRHWAHKRQDATGEQFPVVPTMWGLIIGLPLLAYLATGMPVSFDHPVQGRFNLQGGMTIIPEFVALLIALVAYTAAFIGEIVRAGIQAVSHGQTEAGRSLGLQEGRILNLIVIPQALRVIIPPLTSQYLNLAKNSSLAVGIGYPDMVSVGGTILNQTGQAIEIIAMWMGCYLTISIITSLFMNWYNRRIALVER